MKNYIFRLQIVHNTKKSVTNRVAIPLNNILLWKFVVLEYQGGKIHSARINGKLPTTNGVVSSDSHSLDE